MENIHLKVGLPKCKIVFVSRRKRFLSFLFLVRFILAFEARDKKKMFYDKTETKKWKTHKQHGFLVSCS